MKTKKVKPDIKKYSLAFKKYLSEQKIPFTEADIECKQCHSETKEMLFKFKGKVYKISTLQDIEKTIKGILQIRHLDEIYLYIEYDLFIQVAESVHNHPEFQDTVIQKINQAEPQLADKYIENTFFSALKLSSLADDSAQIFWNTIFEFDDRHELFGVCVLATMEIYNNQAVVDEYIDLLIINGGEYLNELRDGVFESVNLCENKEDPEGDYYYIYTLTDENY